jgi:hypothetical protein
MAGLVKGWASFFLLFMRMYTTPATINPMIASPPTTPPAMAPALLFEGGGAGGAIEDVGPGVEEVVLGGEDEVVENALKHGQSIRSLFTKHLTYQEDLSYRRFLQRRRWKRTRSNLALR